jgi:hypothetical protein
VEKMSDFEKAVRYLCLFKTNEVEVQSNRYLDIEAMVHGDNKLIEKYSKQYEKMIDILAN